MTNDERTYFIETLEQIRFRSEERGWGGEVEALDMAIKALEQTKWISASEKLPEEYIHVLCQFCMGGMAECYYAHGFFHVVGGLRLSIDEVMAWMPLPHPYKAEMED